MKAAWEGSGRIKVWGGSFQVRVSVTEWEQRFRDGAIPEVTALVLFSDME